MLSSTRKRHQILRAACVLLALSPLTGCDELAPVDQSNPNTVGTRAWYNAQAYEFCGSKEKVANMKFNRAWGGYNVQCIDNRRRDIP